MATEIIHLPFKITDDDDLISPLPDHSTPLAKADESKRDFWSKSAMQLKSDDTKKATLFSRSCDGIDIKKPNKISPPTQHHDITKSAASSSSNSPIISESSRLSEIFKKRDSKDLTGCKEHNYKVYDRNNGDVMVYCTKCKHADMLPETSDKIECRHNYVFSLCDMFYCTICLDTKIKHVGGHKFIIQKRTDDSEFLFCTSCSIIKPKFQS